MSSSCVTIKSVASQTTAILTEPDISIMSELSALLPLPSAIYPGSADNIVSLNIDTLDQNMESNDRKSGDEDCDSGTESADGIPPMLMVLLHHDMNGQPVDPV